MSRRRSWDEEGVGTATIALPIENLPSLVPGARIRLVNGENTRSGVILYAEERMGMAWVEIQMEPAGPGEGQQLSLGARKRTRKKG